jgi:hypothetical protein
VAVEIRFRLTGVANVRADVVDERGAVARSLAAGVLGPGIYALAWDGADAQGRPVPDGVYRYVLVAENGAVRAVHDPSTEPWGEEMQPAEFTFDETTGRMRWIQPRAGFARLRAAVSGFPLLETLLDWEPLAGGEQVFDWDGFAASGAVQLAGNPAWITLELFSMPRNTILVARGSRLVEGGTDAPAPATAPAYPPLVAVGGQAHLEAKKPRRDALAPRFAVDLPSAEALDANGRPIVSGMVPVRVSLDPEHAASMTNALFEVAFYVDLTIFFEDEESTNPLTWMWDTSSLTPGPHLLTVNVFSYDGRIGCLTRSVVVESVQ